MYMSHLLDEIVYFMKSYPIHEMETVFFPLSKIIKMFV